MPSTDRAANPELLMRSPLATTTPPPISLAGVRELARKPNSELPPSLLSAMRTQLLAQGREACARELESLFDLETGRAR